MLNRIPKERSAVSHSGTEGNKKKAQSQINKKVSKKKEQTDKQENKKKEQEELRKRKFEERKEEAAMRKKDRTQLNNQILQELNVDINR